MKARKHQKKKMNFKALQTRRGFKSQLTITNAMPNYLFLLIGFYTDIKLH